MNRLIPDVEADRWEGGGEGREREGGREGREMGKRRKKRLIYIMAARKNGCVTSPLSRFLSPVPLLIL